MSQSKQRIFGVGLFAGALAVAFLASPAVSAGDRPGAKPIQASAPFVPLTQAAYFEQALVPLEDECCTDPGEISSCWWEDALNDQVACQASADCPGFLGNPNLTCYKGGATGPLGEGLCFCDPADTDPGQCGAGVCTSTSPSSGNPNDLNLCGPSFCNGYRICSCWAGCAEGPVDRDPDTNQPYATPADMCEDTDQGYPGQCCDGHYSIDSSGMMRGHCCGGGGVPTECENDTDCADANVCNGDEWCDNGICRSGTSVDCGALDTDICDGVQTCNPATGNCDQGGTPLSCDDSDACTTDTCDSATGCEHTANPGGGGACCDPTDPGTYQDANECTYDYCDPRTFHDTHVNQPSGTSCTGGDTCNLAYCDGTGSCDGEFGISGRDCEDPGAGLVNDICGGYTCELDTDGSASCAKSSWGAWVTGLVCDDTDPDPCQHRTCDASGGCTGYVLADGDTCTPVAAGDVCDTYWCQSQVCTLRDSMANLTDPALETCLGGDLGAIDTTTTTSTLSGDNACAQDDYSAIYTGRFSSCRTLSTVSDTVYGYQEKGYTDFQLRHTKVTVRQAAVANPPGFSDITNWDPAVYARTDCEDRQSQVGCSDNCNFANTNMPTTCNGLAGNDSALMTGPVAVKDYPTPTAKTSAAADAWTTEDGARDVSVIVDAKPCTTAPPCPPGGEYQITAALESHLNDDCRATGSYAAAPALVGGDSWRERWRGNTDMNDANAATFYRNFFWNKRNTEPTCWGGGAFGANDPGTALYYVNFPRVADDMGSALQVDWEQNYKIMLDYYGLANAGIAGITPLNPVLATWGLAGSNAEASCVSAVTTSGQQACAPVNASWLPRPREVVVSQTSAWYQGWVSVSNYTAGTANRGDYELEVIRAPRPFANVGQAFVSDPGDDCGCGADEDENPPDEFFLEGYRVDFVPSNHQDFGYTVYATNSGMGNDWLVDPDRAVGSYVGGPAGTVNVLERSVFCSGLACTAINPATPPLDIGFAMPYSGQFWNYFCIDAAGRVELGEPTTDSCNLADTDTSHTQDCIGHTYENTDSNGQRWTCKHAYDKVLSSGKMASRAWWRAPGDWHSPAPGDPNPSNTMQTGYAPSLAPLWGDLIPCWNANQIDPGDDDLRWDSGNCVSKTTCNAATCQARNDCSVAGCNNASTCSQATCNTESCFQADCEGASACNLANCQAAQNVATCQASCNANKTAARTCCKANNNGAWNPNTCGAYTDPQCDSTDPATWNASCTATCITTPPNPCATQNCANQPNTWSAACRDVACKCWGVNCAAQQTWTWPAVCRTAAAPCGSCSGINCNAASSTWGAACRTAAACGACYTDNCGAAPASWSAGCRAAACGVCYGYNCAADPNSWSAACRTAAGSCDVCAADNCAAADPLSTWSAGCQAVACSTGASNGTVTSQLVAIQGATARVITWNGFDGYYMPKNYKRSANEALQFQVLLFADGRVTYFYKKPNASTKHAWNLVWDKIRSTNGWTVSMSGTRSASGCRGQVAEYCDNQLQVDTDLDRFECDDDFQTVEPGDGNTYYVYQPSSFCGGWVNFQKDSNSDGTLDLTQYPDDTDPVEWYRVP